MSNSLKVGLTGNYLSGVNDVASIFRRYKVPVFDCDLMIKYLIYNSEEHIEAIKETFGDTVFSDGIVDVSKLEGYDESTGKLKFHVLLKLLEFDLKKFYEAWRLKHNNATYTIFKSQILYEFGFHSWMNLNINCLRPIRERATELHEHYNFSYEDAYKLLENEMEESHKNSFSTYTVYSYENYYLSVEDQISNIHKSLKNKVYNPVIQPGSAAEYVD